MTNPQIETKFKLNCLVAMLENPDLAHASDGGILRHADGSAEFWLPTPDGNESHAGKYDYVSEWGHEACVKYLEDAK